MNWPDLVGPAVVAAVVSGTVSIIGSWLSLRSASQTSSDRIRADAELAKAKALADIGLARAQAELKVEMDNWRRNSDFAEKLLADFYRARDVFRSARRAFSYGGEGMSRPNREADDPLVQNRKDAIYAPLERLNAEKEFLGKLHAARFRAEALFGTQAAEPFFEFVQAYNSVAIAANELIENVGKDTIDREWEKELRADLGWVKQSEDPIQPKLENAVSRIEAICRAVLDAKPGSVMPDKLGH